MITKKNKLIKLNKALIFLISLLLLFGLVSCEYNDEIITEDDNILPIILLQPGMDKIKVNQNDVVDLKALLIEKGITAVDNIDGVITENIEIKTNDFDITKSGSYFIDVFVFDSSDNKSEVKFIEIIVEEYFGLLANFPIYNQQIENEVTNITPQRVFKGAYYYKSVSSIDYWRGIEGTITLPEFEIKRYNNSYDETLNIDPNVKNLDNPSIYFGGNAFYESDVGLSLSSTLLKNGNISTGSYAFRPFWRYITSSNELNKDLGGYDLINGRRYAVGSTNASETNLFANWYYGDTEYYYLPGDKLRIIVYSPKDNFLQLQIQVIEKSTLPESLKIRNENNWEDPKDFISPLFVSQGHGLNSLAEFKRVNAIDQTGNEGSDVTPTNSNVKEAVWESLYLYRVINNEMYRIPFNSHRSNTLAAPSQKYFTASEVNEDTGGFKLTINPSLD